MIFKFDFLKTIMWNNHFLSRLERAFIRAFTLIKNRYKNILQKKKRLLPSENKGNKKKLCYCRWTGAELITLHTNLGRFIYCASYRQMAQHRDGIHTTSSFNHGSKSLVITVRLSSQRESERELCWDQKKTSIIKRISFSYPHFLSIYFFGTLYTHDGLKKVKIRKSWFPPYLTRLSVSLPLFTVPLFSFRPIRKWFRELKKIRRQESQFRTVLFCIALTLLCSTLVVVAATTQKSHTRLHHTNAKKNASLDN